MDKRKWIAGLLAIEMILPMASYAQNVDEVFDGLDSFVEHVQTQGSSLLEDSAKNIQPVSLQMKTTFSEASEMQDRISQYAHAQLGKTYRYGAYGPDQFDCSGLIFHVFGLAGKKVPRTSKAQSEAGVPVDRKDLRVGDIVFFDTRHTGNLNNIKIDVEDTLSLFAGDQATQSQPDTFKLGKVTHSGIYIGDGKFIHASSGSVMKVVIEELDSKYFSQRYLFAKRYE
ncbi:MAG: C40 family peptidase [Peptostreptococcaceae bacterium]|nr:C40 family peptidase [Peptostreptococcaceae bacterium]